MCLSLDVLPGVSEWCGFSSKAQTPFERGCSAQGLLVLELGQTGCFTCLNEGCAWVIWGYRCRYIAQQAIVSHAGKI